MNKVTEALTEVQQAQQTVVIALSTFLRNGGRDAAARLDAAILDEQRTIERWCSDRREYLAK
jgi:hypothetical protein